MSSSPAGLLLRPFGAVVLIASLLTAAQAAAAPETPVAITHHWSPEAVITVTVASGALDAYLAELRSFSNKYKFAILITPTTHSGENFGVQMYREDIRVKSANATPPATLLLAFYTTCEFETPITRQNIAAMVADLKGALSKTKGLAIEP